MVFGTSGNASWFVQVFVKYGTEKWKKNKSLGLICNNRTTLSHLKMLDWVELGFHDKCSASGF